MATVFELKNISCEFGAEKVLSDVSFSVFEGDRIGIVGDNGCGKTTLLNILAQKTDDLSVGGSIFRNSTKSLGYLLQSAGGSDSDETLENYMLSAFSTLLKAEEKIAATEAELSKLSESGASEQEITACSEKLSQMYEAFSENGGLTFRSQIKSTLAGLKFPEDSYQRSIRTLSGGQKIRLALGKLLLEKPDVLLLDEPTNHLDSESIAFLEESVSAYPGTIITVSHDRAFLDNTTTKTLAIENGGVGTLYNAPYTKYKVLRDADIEYKHRQFLRQQKEISHINDVITTQKRWNQEHNYVTANAWQKKLDRIEVLADPTKVTDNLPAIAFESDVRGGNDVLLCQNVSFGFPNSEPLFADFSLDLKRGERLFIHGINGSGKTTLLRIIIGELAPTKGSIKLGQNIKISYYSQNFSDIDLTKTPFEEIFDSANYDYYNNHGGLPKFVNIYRVRSALAAFGFYGDDCFKPASVLSGGEKARLSMLKLTYNKANLLILDEPTNHLDIKTCEILEDALLSFDGTIICVSHDRYFRERLATRTINFDDYSVQQGQNSVLAGNVSSKNAKGNVTTAKEDAIAQYKKQKEDKANARKLAKQKERLEEEMNGLIARIKELEDFLASGSSDFAAINEAFSEKEQLQTTLDEKELLYLELCEE